MNASKMQRSKGWLGALVVVGYTACGGTVEEPPTALIGDSEQPIIGGDEALLGEWPWQAQLDRYGSHWCGGSVIAERWVVTAAHCVAGQLASAFDVSAGLIDRAAPGPQAQTLGVLNLIVHPDYDPVDLSNDVALMELDGDFTFDAFVQPIALSDAAAPIGQTAFVTGWGNTSPGSGSSNDLMETTLPIQSQRVCNGAGTLPLTVDETMVCAGFVGGEQGGCHGDSGGPLVMPSSSFSGGWQLVGTVSWGVGGTCSSYTVFGRVSEFVSWAMGHVGSTPVVGDVTGDGCVDANDHNAVMASFGQTVPPADASLDLNGDGVIDVQDRLVVLQNFGEGC